MSEETAVRKLTAILYGDVAGYSRLTGDDELGTHRSVMDALDFATESITSGGGTVLRYAGDAILAEFSSVVAAVNAAVGIQTELEKRNAGGPAETRVQIRIGVNLGEVLEDRGEIYGDDVNLAARLESAAHPGGICISQTVHDQVVGKIDVGFEDGGEASFKNIAKAVRVYYWQPDPASVKGGRASSRRPATKEKPSIAVLPFDNMSGDPAQEYLADGISEDLITALSKIRSFVVIARNSTFTYKGKAVDAKQIARDLNVRYILEGSVRKAGKRVRITAQLIDASTGHHVWAERYDRELADIFDLQDDMTQTLVGALEPELNAAERELAINKPPENLDAWEIYQRALWYMWTFEKDKVSAAVDLFRRAIEIDPSFASAYAYLSYTHYQHVVMGWVNNPDRWLTEGRAAAKKALQCDDKDAIAYFSAGRIHMMRGEHDKSVAALETSLELNPSFAQSYHGLGMVLALSGRHDEAVGMTEKAIALSPREPMMWAFTVVHAFACILRGDDDDALVWAHKTVQNPNATGYWPYAVLAAASANLGNLDEAGEACQLALQQKPDLTLTFVNKNLPTKHEGGLAHYLEGLRKAGLPE